MMEKKYKPVDLVIKNAKMVVDQQLVDGGIAVDEGKIVGISKGTKLPPGDKVIDLEFQLLIPGIIDIHAHLRDLNYRSKEDFYTGTCAAANGGITSVIDMPNTNPPTVSAKLLEEKLSLAQKKVVVNTGFYAGIPNKFNEIESLRLLGIFGLKLYLSHSLSQFDIDNSESVQDLLQETKKSDIPLLIHAERKSDIETILKQKKGSGLNSQELYLESHSEEVERRAIDYILQLNATINSAIHICHVSTAKGLKHIRKLKKKRGKLSVEVTPHHLFLTKADLKAYGAYAKMLPPLRKSNNLRALWEGLNDGTIDIVATDHAPHMLTEKECDFALASNGIPGFETMVPLMFTAMHQDKIGLARLVQVMSENPALFLGLSSKGKISLGFDADFTVINMKKEARIKAADFYSKAKFSPFDGREVKGIPTMTIVNGEVVMKEGEILMPMGSGNIIKRPLKSEVN